jgi:acetyl-CoA/propionyl-CoA carboxylase biotin carboxyl carrier protein
MWEDGSFYFLEMNTRIQVEHTVTEEITGIDLVKWQIRVAQGASLPWSQEQIELRGHAIECRINAEDPSAGFSPSLGKLTTYFEPHGFGIRVESGYRQGSTIPPHYDSLIAKLIAWGQNRDEALQRMRRALRDFEIEGVRSTIPFHRWAIAHPVFRDGQATVRFVEEHLNPAHLASQDGPEAPVADEPDALAGARVFAVEVNGRRFQVRVAGQGAAPNAASRRNTTAQRPSRQADDQGAGTGTIRSPIGGTVAAVRIEPGSTVEPGQVLLVIEAMKMENEIVAPRTGVVGEVHVATGVAVQAGEILVTFA